MGHPSESNMAIGNLYQMEVPLGKKTSINEVYPIGHVFHCHVERNPAIPEETLKQRGHVLQKFRLSPSLQLQCPMRKKDKPIVYLKLIRPAATNKQLNQRLKEKTRWGKHKKMLVQGEDHPLGFPVKNANQDTVIRTPFELTNLK